MFGEKWYPSVDPKHEKIITNKTKTSSLMRKE